MIKGCFHPCNVANGDSTVILWDRESQESLEKKKVKSEVLLSLNEIAFYFSMSLSGFSIQNLHFVMLVYSINIFHFFNDKSFLTDIFNQKTSSFFFFSPLFELIFTYIEGCCREDGIFRSMSSTWVISNSREKQGKIRKCFLL